MGSPVYSIAVSSDGALVGCGRGSGDIAIMRAQGQEWIGNANAHLGVADVPVRGLAFDAASRLLLSGGDDNHVALLDAAAMARRRPDSALRNTHLERFSAHRGWVTSVSTCPDPRKRVLVTTSWDATVKLWDYSTHILLRTYKEHTDSVFASAFAPDGQFFATVGVDANIALYTPKLPSDTAAGGEALVAVEKGK